MASEVRHRGWTIDKGLYGWWFEHPDHDPENSKDWHYGWAQSVEEARQEIDALIAQYAARASVSGDQ